MSLNDIRIFAIIINIVFTVSILTQILATIHLETRFKDKKDKQNNAMRKLLACTFCLAISSYLGISSKNPEFARIFYTLYMVLFSFTVYFYYSFVDIYTNISLLVKHSASTKIFFALLCFDVINVASNLLFNHVFTVEQIEIFGNVYNGINTSRWHGLHWFVCITAIEVAIIKLIIVDFRVPYSYRPKYRKLIGAIVGIALVSAFTHAFDLAIDITPLIIPFIAVVTYYFSFVSSPQIFIQASRDKIVEKLEDGIILFDYRKKFQGVNDIVKDILGCTNENVESAVDKWIRINNFDLDREWNRKIEQNTENGVMILNVSCFHYYEKGRKRILSGIYLKINDMTKFYKQQQEMNYIVSHDSLTGLMNRGAFCNAVEEYLSENTVGEYYLVCTDIQNFKLFNDLFGEEVGDQYLYNLGYCFSKYVLNPIKVGRIAGDIFAILIKKEDFSEIDIKVTLEKVNEMIEIDNYKVNVYVGVYEIVEKDKGTAATAMCDKAIMAASRIKGDPEKYVEFYDEKIIEEKHKERALIEELKKALENDEFVIFIQPQVTRDKVVKGGEALVRWNHPERGILSPYFFVDAMERFGLITELDLAVWRKACQQLAEWYDNGITDRYISVNISTKDFYHLDIYKVFTGLIDEYMIEPESLKLEITESAIMQNPEENISLIKRLQNVGFTVEMDDFGSGYSSLNMLNQISIDVLKLDMGFLSDGLDRGRSRAIIKSIQNLAKDLGMGTVVEGVETAEQEEFLISIGCDVFQGYLFSKPIPVSDFENKYFQAGA